MVNASPSTHRPRLAAILIVPVVVVVVLTLFALPTAKVGPRDLPVGVASAPAIAHTLAAEGGKFDVHRYATEAGARAAIEDREIYGAFVGTPSGPKLLIATAGSPAVAQMLSHAASAAGDEVLIEDVVASTPAGGALLGGTVATLIIQSWLDVVGGDWLANAGVLSLTVLAIAATAAGLEALLGKAGLAVAAVRGRRVAAAAPAVA